MVDKSEIAKAYDRGFAAAVSMMLPEINQVIRVLEGTKHTSNENVEIALILLNKVRYIFTDE